MPRYLTASEKEEAKKLWPRMNVDSVVATDEATKRYNCLAWTVEITNRWLWPWGSRNATKSEFDDLYLLHGYKPSKEGSIAAFGISSSSMTHGSISGDRHGARWESKCGAWLRLRHGLAEMAGGYYGHVRGFYGPDLSHPFKGGKPVSPNKMPATKMSLPKSESLFIQKRAAKVEKKIKSYFEKTYESWKADWQRPAILVSSNPVDRTYSPYFLQLAAMGQDILPLLMNKLASDVDDFFALQVADRLLPEALVVRFDLADKEIFTGEQGRAIKTVRRWVSYEG